MQRTISAMVGKGSVNHNSRKFKAENVDGNRTHLNIDYCNESIKKVYHELFDEALKRYNDRQTRADRKIENYYEKIRSSKQEKQFHELILQIGDKENMSAESESGELARQILDEYYRGFQERNPRLKVFSAHLHMDEATPHLHIDFIPFTTGSKRGLDTRVSLKQALAAQGFKGGSRGDTEWNQWVQSEKEQLAAVMERHGIEWEHKGTHEKHLSVLDYKKQERQKELEVLEDKLTEKKDEFRVMAYRIENFDNGERALKKLDESIMNEPEYQLPEPAAMMSARSYKAKFVEPLIAKLKSLIKTLFARYFKAIDSYNRLNVTNRNLYRENTVYVEMKNKHNTMNSASAGKTFIKMQNQLLNDDDCACFLVEAIAQRSQNIKWETTVDKKKVGHKLIRRVSLDKFYALVTGQEDAFYQMCMILPSVIEKVVKELEGTIVPHDTVIDELRAMASEQNIESEDLAIAMAVYMLGFGSYKGFTKK